MLVLKHYHKCSCLNMKVGVPSIALDFEQTWWYGEVALSLDEYFVTKAVLNLP